MATIPVPPEADDAAPKKRSRRRKTAHLKGVPQNRSLREQLKQRCEEVADKLDKARPLTKDEMETVARNILKEAGEPESYVGWIMVFCQRILA